MSKRQLWILLLNGCSICGYGMYGYRIRDTKGNPIGKMKDRAFAKLNSQVLRQTKKGYWVLDKRLVRSQHGNTLIKKLYRQQLQSNSNNSK